MKGLDQTDLFKYSGNKPKREPMQQPYVQSNIILYKYNAQTGSNVSQGNFVLQLKPTPQGVHLIIQRAGAVALLDNIITRKINWQLRGVNCYFTDTSNVQWTMQFKDAVDASMVTAEVGLILTCNSTKTVSFYEPPQNGSSPPISPGDTVKIEFYAFSINPFPRIGSLFSSSENMKAALSDQSLAVGLYQGMIGMTPNHTRTIFVPQNMLATSAGYRESSTPNTPAVFVVTVTNVKYLDEKKAPKPEPEQQKVAPKRVVEEEKPKEPEYNDSDDDDDDEWSDVEIKSKVSNEIEKKEVVKEKIEEPKPEPEPKKEPEPEPAVEEKKAEPVKEVEDEAEKTEAEEKEEAEAEDPEGDSVAAKIAKFKKIGIMTPLGSMGVPFALMKKKQREEEERKKEEERKRDESEKSFTDDDKAEVQPEPVQVMREIPSPERKKCKTPDKKEIKTPEKTERKLQPATPTTPHESDKVADNELIKSIEDNLANKISALKHADIESPDAVARGVGLMAAQIKVADSTIENMKKQIEEKKLKSSSSGVLHKQLITAQSEVEALKKQIAKDERTLRESEARIQALSAAQKIRQSHKQPPDQEGAKKKANGIIKDLMQSVFEEMNNHFDERVSYNGQEVIDTLFDLLQKQSYKAMDIVEKEGLF